METRPRNVAFNIQMCDNGKHRRKDRPNGGMYVTEAEAATTIAAMPPSTQTVAVCEVPETEITKSNNPEHCIGLKYRVSASSYHPFSVDHSQALAAMCDQAVSYEIKPEEHPLSPKKTSAITQYGEECAGTITAEFDGMPCPDRGPSAVAIGVFNMDEHTPEPETSLDNGQTGNLIPSSPEKPLIMEAIGVSFDGRKDIPMLNECSQTETVGTNPGHKIGVAIGFKAGQSANGGLGDEVEVCQTCQANPNSLEPTVVYPINGMILGKCHKEGDRQTTGIGSKDDPCPTIQTQHHHAVAQIKETEEMENQKTFAKTSHAINKNGDGEKYDEVDVAQTLNTFQNNSESRAIELVSEPISEAVGFSHIASGVMLDCKPQNTATTIKACSAGEGAAIIGVDGYNQTITGEIAPTLSGVASDFHHTHGVIAEGIDPYNLASTEDTAATIGVNCGMSTGRNGVAISLDQKDKANEEQHGVAIGMKYLASEKSRSPISIEHAQALAAGCPDSAVAYETDKTVGFLPTNSANAHTIGAEEEVCPTLAKGSGESGNKPTVDIGCDRRNQNGSEEVQTAIQSSVSDGGATCAIDLKSEGFGETGPGYWQHGCQTLRAEGENRPSRPSNVAVIGLNAEPGTRADAYPIEACNPICRKHKEGVMLPVESTPMPLTHIVRRLTVTECERLMGFPDNYTKIPYRNKPYADCPDSPRYKALGNSWATNCAEWVLRRIVKAIKDGRA